MNEDGPVIAIDSREQKPYAFPVSKVVALRTADYSIVGMEHLVAIERKTLADAYASLGRGRARFEAEVERMAALDYGAIVIEASLPEFLQGPLFSQMNPKAAINSLLAWAVRFGIGVFFAGDRRYGNAITQTLLEKYWTYNRNGRAVGVERRDDCTDLRHPCPRGEQR